METVKTETITWADLKEAANKMSEEQLNTPVYLAQDDEYWIKINEVVLVEEDIYVNNDDNDDAGTLKELQELHEDEFVLENYKLMAEKGTPFLSITTEYEFEALELNKNPE
jgi:hypothetical protein